LYGGKVAILDGEPGGWASRGKMRVVQRRGRMFRFSAAGKAGECPVMTGMKDHEDEDAGNDHYKQKDRQQKCREHFVIKFAHTTSPTYARISLIQTEKRKMPIIF
jgi:hypothetical protein